jgi:hypothetical protein
MKRGPARLTYSAVVPDPAVFFALFKVPTDFKKKQIKIPHLEFEKDVVKTWIRQSGPWNRRFSISGDMTVNWNKEELSFKVTGAYS